MKRKKDNLTEVRLLLDGYADAYVTTLEKLVNETPLPRASAQDKAKSLIAHLQDMCSSAYALCVSKTVKTEIQGALKAITGSVREAAKCGEVDLVTDLVNLLPAAERIAVHRKDERVKIAARVKKIKTETYLLWQSDAELQDFIVTHSRAGDEFCRKLPGTFPDNLLSTAQTIIHDSLDPLEIAAFIRQCELACERARKKPKRPPPPPDTENSKPGVESSAKTTAPEGAGGDEAGGQANETQDQNTDSGLQENRKGKQAKEPSKEAKQAYLLYNGSGYTQTDVAKEMTVRLKKPVSQGQVSKWINQYKTWRDSVGLPVDDKKPKIIFNTDILGMGPRTDGKTTGDPRHKHKQSADHGDNRKQ